MSPIYHELQITWKYNLLIKAIKDKTSEFFIYARVAITWLKAKYLTKGKTADQARVTFESTMS